MMIDEREVGAVLAGGGTGVAAALKGLLAGSTEHLEGIAPSGGGGDIVGLESLSKAMVETVFQVIQFGFR